MAVSREGSLAVGEITLPNTGEVIIVASMYAAWEKPDTNPGSSWIYADASAHRLISDLSALIGRERGQQIIVAGLFCRSTVFSLRPSSVNTFLS